MIWVAGGDSVGRVADDALLLMPRAGAVVASIYEDSNGVLTLGTNGPLAASRTTRSGRPWMGRKMCRRRCASGTEPCGSLPTGCGGPAAGGRSALHTRMAAGS